VRSESAPSLARAPEREERLTKMMAAHFDFVWRLLRRSGWSESEADDGTQEVFLVAVRRLDHVAPDRERAFLYGAALRVMWNARRGWRRRRESPEVDLNEHSAPGPLPDAAAELSRARELLDDILRRLPPQLARVVVLAEIEQLQVTEIAALEQIPVGTAASRLKRGRELLRKHLSRLGHAASKGRSHDQ
jgi:RNA polymerase sigma-70 factor, ECF subfamily